MQFCLDLTYDRLKSMDQCLKLWLGWEILPNPLNVAMNGWTGDLVGGGYFILGVILQV